jgi:hypothetical protein
MEVKRSEISEHATDIARIFAGLCGTKLVSPLVGPLKDEGAGELVLAIVGGPPNPALPHRTVTTDLGLIETVLGLPIPDAKERKFWIGLNESWELHGKYKVSFRNCGLRLYIGAANEESRQFLRLEWAAPEMTKDGIAVYQGAHAGHPHWHVDRAALVGPEEHLRSLEILTAPIPADIPLEVFGYEGNISQPIPFVQDLSWLKSVHLPAQAQWMHHNWDGFTLPAPHQSAPEGLQMLTRWWEGSLRYLFAELSRHAS